MDNTLRHLRAFEFAATTSLIAVAILGLPLLAATNVSDDSDTYDQYYAETIILQFQKIAASTGIYDNKAINSSAFDLVQYMTDICYRPTENDIPACKQKYGPYFNLKDTMDSGKLAAILSLRPYFAGVEQLFPAKPKLKDESNLTSDQIMQQQIDERSQEVWDECQQLSTDRYGQNRCFQRNIRLTVQRRIQVKGNVYTD